MSTQQRAVPRGVLQSRAARTVARPYSARLGEWQSTSIKLVTMAGRSSGEDGAIRTAAGQLLEAVAAAESDFEAEVLTLPEPVQQHAAIIDTRGGFTMIRGRLSKALQQL